jgi:D-glycero-D-manno-heptose 1,7-bisphosphate phosphatase
MTPAVFLDRDGTINTDVGYLNHPDQLELIPRSGLAIKLLNEAGFKTVVITNQAGIAKGLLQEEILPEIHNRLSHLLDKEDARIDAFYYCPHHPEAAVEQYRIDCQCRKPFPGMILHAAEDLGIDVTRSFVIGDKSCDIELAHNVGAKAIMVMTGYGETELVRHTEAKLPLPHHTASDLYDAVQWIVKTNTVQQLL